MLISRISVTKLTRILFISLTLYFRNPGLFSLISSLHSSHQVAVRADPSLRPLLRPPQTSCYCFTVTLGSTCLLPCEEEVVIPLSPPSWSLQQAFKVGQQYIFQFLLYMVLLYCKHGMNILRDFTWLLFFNLLQQYCNNNLDNNHR